MKTRFLSLLWLALTLAGPTQAQTTTFEIPQGGFAGGGAPVLDQEGLLMLQAMQQAMNGDFKGAEAVYTSILSNNPQSADAYLHRGVLRRELKNTAGAQSDGKALVNLTNAQLQRNPRDPNLYYQRGMAYRLLGRYDQAMKDIESAIRMGGDPDWRSDLRDTMLEEKASRGIVQ